MNKRRHTQLFRALALIVFPVACAYLITTCGHMTKPPRAIPLPRPDAVTSAAPTLGTARKAAESAALEADRARQSASKAKAGLVEAQLDLRDLVAETDRLRRQKAASENELIALYNRMVEREKQHSILVSDLVDVETALEKERLFSADMRTKLGEAETLVIQKDSEVAALRGVLDHSEKVTQSYADQLDASSKLIVRLQSSFDIERGKVRVLLCISGALGAILIVLILLKIAKRSAFPFLR